MEMNKPIREYFVSLKDLFDKVIVTGPNKKIYEFNEAIHILIRMIIKQASLGRKLLFIGNGGSASIASHMAVDFWKNAGIRAVSFNDSSLLTCISNDYGYKYVFQKPIEKFADRGDILFAISSSGKSENILRGVDAAKKKGANVVTLSAFDKGNPLRKSGKLNFYVPASEYGYVEIIHLCLCHCLVDIIMKKQSVYKRR